MSQHTDNPFLFACGVPRSGTTLLQRMLNSHPEVAVANDSHFVPRALELTDKSLTAKAESGDVIPLSDMLIEKVRNYHRFYRLGISDEDFATASLNARTYQQLVSELYSQFACNHGKRLAGEKTPDYVRRLRLLHGLFPNSKLIHLVRDGRNVALSLLNWAKPNKGPGRIEWWNRYPIAVCALWWRWLVMEGRDQARAITAASVAEVKYESLTNNPGDSMELLCEFLNLDFSPKMLDYHRGKSKEQGSGSAKSAWLAPQTGLRDWRRDMEPLQVEVFEALAFDALEEYGYELSGKSSSTKAHNIARKSLAWWEDNFLTRHNDLGSTGSHDARSTNKLQTSEVLCLDEQLPGLRFLFDTSSLSRRLDKRNVEILNVRYKPKTSCLISYRASGKGGEQYVHAKAFAADDWPTRKEKFSDSVLVDDDLAVAVFSFPDDAELPQLGEFVRNPQSFLGKVLFDEFLNRELTGYQILAYKPNRRLVARLDYGEEHLVLKMHDSASFENVQESIAALKRLGFSDAPVRQGKSTRHQTFAHEWLHGTTLDLGEVSPSDCNSLLDQIFGYLDQLHQPIATKRVGLPVRVPGEGVKGVSNYLKTVSPLGDLSNRLSDKILTNLSTDYSPTLIHGDFYDHQLIVNENRVRACDFDNCCVSDPVIDLANMIAHLRLRVAQDQLPNSVADFVNEQVLRHLSESGGNELTSRFNWNTAACLFRLSTHPFRSGARDWVKTTDSVLQNVRSLVSASTRSTVSASAASSRIRGASEITSDPKLAFLEEAFEPVTATKRLREYLPELETLLGRFAVNQVYLRRHKRGRRCLLEFELATDQGLVSILGKASARKLDRRAFKTARRLFKNYDFRKPNKDHVFVPRPIGCCDPWQMWFQLKVDAISAGELMQRESLEQFTSQIAASISKLHCSGFKTNREHSVACEMSILGKRLAFVAAASPELADKINRVLRNCEHIAGSIVAPELSSIHRDFYQDQILFAENQTWLVDLDLVAMGNPALDVGNFVAHLTEDGIRNYGDSNYWINVEADIVRQYCRLNPNCPQFDIEAFKAISLARHISISHSMVDRQFATEMIVENVANLTDELLNRNLDKMKSEIIGVKT